MELNNFINEFASQFDETEMNLFNANTDFKSLEEWSSLMALSIIAMADESYGIKLKGDDIKESTTIEDLFSAIKSKQ